MSREMVEKPGDAGKAGRSEDHTAVKVPVASAHQLSNDPWFQVAVVLMTGVNCAFVLGYPGAVMVPLGWGAGVIGLILATLASLHANMLVAKLHEYGGKRHIRYRDLAGAVYGPKAYAITWALQYVNLYLINVGYIILAGHSLKATYHIFRSDNEMKLPYFIAIAGVACGLFAISIPHLSALRIWLGFSSLFGLLYIFIGFGLSIKNGKESPPRDYSIPGSTKDKIFSSISAAANLVFSFNTGMLPEIQATVKQPMITNTLKALYFQFTVGVIPMYLIIFGGYWAFGNETEDYLLNNVHGPAWTTATANLAAFLQSVIALHIFASPMYEYLDTRFDIVGPALKPRNITFRVVVRGGYIAVTAFVAAMLPFIDDFMSLTGAISTFPLTFILAHHMYITAKGDKLSVNQKRWHWANVAFFTTLAIATAISSVRSIAKDSTHFSIFADI